MNKLTTPSIIEHFSPIPAPRVERNKCHQLSDMIFITLCAVICGADGWVAVETFGKAKEDGFTKVLSLKYGIPSHDTFGNVFAVIDIDEFSKCFANWVSDLTELK